MPKPTAKPATQESPSGPAPETRTRPAIIVTALLIAVWLAVTLGADRLAPWVGDIASQVELTYGLYEVQVVPHDDEEEEEE